MRPRQMAPYNIKRYRGVDDASCAYQITGAVLLPSDVFLLISCRAEFFSNDQANERASEEGAPCRGTAMAMAVATTARPAFRNAFSSSNVIPVEVEFGRRVF